MNCFNHVCSPTLTEDLKSIFLKFLLYILYRWVEDERILPTYDTVQNLQNTMVIVENGKTMMSFRRAIITGDDNQDLNLDQCVYLLWGWGGNVSDYTTPAMFDEHKKDGVFPNQLCLQQCSGKC